ncbi:MAG: hypothetical protein ABIJ92_01315 [Candidatus Aenigmatarchaeota archaeon]
MKQNLEFIIGGFLVVSSLWAKDWTYYVSTNDPNSVAMPMLAFVVVLLAGLILIADAIFKKNK